MPRGDGTGPAGLGSGTGRALGNCAGTDAPGSAGTPGGGFGWVRGQAGGGRGCGWGRGRGGLRRGGFLAAGPAAKDGPVAPESGRLDIQGRLAAMEASLAAIKAHLDSKA